MDSKSPQIEKGIPIPGRYGYGYVNDLLKKMEVGDSVYFPDKDPIQVRQSYYNLSKRLGIKMTYRKDGSGARMWRVA